MFAEGHGDACHVEPQPQGSPPAVYLTGNQMKEYYMRLIFSWKH